MKALISEMNQIVEVAGGPDPLTMKAFLSEYEQGKKRGEELGKKIDQKERRDEMDRLQDEITAAAIEVEDLADRIASYVHGARINPERFAAKVSRNMSTMFYNFGMYDGLFSGG